MITLVSIELYKIFKKWRTYIGFLALVVLAGIIHTAMYYQGQSYVDNLLRSFQNMFFISGNLLNAYFIAHLILFSLAIHIPFLITLVAGDLLAGEATSGAYRIMLTRPITRFQLITSKYLAGIIYTALLIIFLAAVSLIPGIVIFGTGELLTIKNKIIILEQSDLWWRFLGAYGFATLSMATVAGLAFFFSSLVENAIGPIIATMAIVIIFLIISNLQFEFVENIKPYLFTTYMDDWSEYFNYPVDFDSIWKSSLVLFLHVVGFYAITLFLFQRKDILS